MTRPDDSLLDVHQLASVQRHADRLLREASAVGRFPTPVDDLLTAAKLTVVDFEFLTRLDPPTTLREIKESHLFDDWSLVRQSRLSTMAAPKAFVEWMRKKHPKPKI